uniref:Secreted protein n=1 Tax=Strongyloides papillosus TaxID=174720 RepID=A0A0N5BHT6_STREA
MFFCNILSQVPNNKSLVSVLSRITTRATTSSSRCLSLLRLGDRLLDLLWLLFLFLEVARSLEDDRERLTDLPEDLEDDLPEEERDESLDLEEELRLREEEVLVDLEVLETDLELRDTDLERLFTLSLSETSPFFSPILITFSRVSKTK